MQGVSVVSNLLAFKEAITNQTADIQAKMTLESWKHLERSSVSPSTIGATI